MAMLNNQMVICQYVYRGFRHLDEDHDVAECAGHDERAFTKKGL